MEWSKTTKHRKVFLTFDDGPVPIATEFVLEQLYKYGAKATFFMVGHNIQKYPEIAKLVLNEGHQIGNHTHNHVNGWKTTDEAYFDNIEKAKQTIEQLGYKPNGRMLFRPPYGRISYIQRNHLQSLYRIIMWDVLTGDFDKSLPSELCLKKSLNSINGGSIVTFHDSLKAFDKLKYVLPRFLEELQKQDYSFGNL